MQDLPDVSEHPDYLQEKQHLEDTIATIEELETILADLLNQKVSYGSVATGFEQQDRVVEEFLRQGRSGELAQLQSAEGKPYFGRYDFLKKGSSEMETYYIGRVGINEFRKCDHLGNQYVIDWRSPVGHGFYNIEDGKTSFTTPGGFVTGNVRLKRQFEIEYGKMIHIADEGGLADKLRADPFLQRVLQRGASQKLKDIVATIQREQDAIIRQPLNKALLVQGVAGSGKTTIGLHRISYLLYRYRELLKPDKIAFIAPNKVFLDYISDVLPEIDVKGIRQLTLRELFAGLTGSNGTGKKSEQKELPAGPVFAAPPNSREERLQYMKGTLAYRDAIKVFCQAWENRYAKNLLSFKLKIVNADVVIEAGKLKQILADTHTPLNIRLNNMIKSVKRSSKAQIVSRLDLFVVERNQGKKNGKNTGSVHTRQSEMPEEYGKALNKLGSQPPLTAWTKVEAAELYGEFLRSAAYRNLCACHELAPAVSPAEAQLWKQSDDDALTYIHILLNGIPAEAKCGHIVLDEAQECSPFEVSLLKEFSANGSITLLGDLNQSSRNRPWFIRWGELAAGALAGLAAECIELTTSYRSVGEIVDFTNRLLPKSSTKAIPVYFGRENPQVYETATPAEAIDKIASRVAELIGAGCKSVGIVTRDPAGAAELYLALSHSPKPLSAAVALIDDSVTEFRGGVSVLPVQMAKGLEFEAVIIANGNDRQYPGSSSDQRLLYIACTRALHHLDVFYEGNISPLLAAEDTGCAAKAGENRVL